MLEFLQNEWVIGIGTGTISGIILFYVSQWLVNKTGRAEYIEKVKNANREVIAIITPYVADMGLPDERVLDAIINSIARKYNIHRSEMYSIEFFCEELIGNIIRDDYISNSQKEKYTKELAQYIKNIINKEGLDKATIYQEMFINQVYRNEKFKRLSVIYALAILIETLILTFVSVYTKNYEIWVYPFNKYPILLVIVVIIIIGMVCYMFKSRKDIER